MTHVNPFKVNNTSSEFSVTRRGTDPEKLGRRLTLTFSPADEPELEKIRFICDEKSEPVSLELGASEKKMSYQWGRVAKGFSLLFLDYVCWEKGDASFAFVGQSDKDIVSSVGYDRYKNTGIIRRIFIEKRKGAERELAGQVLKICYLPTTMIPRSIRLRPNFLPSKGASIKQSPRKAAIVMAQAEKPVRNTPQLLKNRSSAGR